MKWLPLFFIGFIIISSNIVSFVYPQEQYKSLRTWGSQGAGNSQFVNPSAVAVDPSGNVCVLDSGNNRVQKFTSDGTFLTTWGSSGKGNGQFSSPYGIAIDSSGNVYITENDNDRIQVFSPNT